MVTISGGMKSGYVLGYTHKKCKNPYKSRLFAEKDHVQIPPSPLKEKQKSLTKRVSVFYFLFRYYNGQPKAVLGIDIH